MLRRLTVLLVMWVGLLGAASPALACAMEAALAGDCCPPGSTLPCGERGSPDFNAVAPAICCVTASAPAPAVAIDSGRSLYKQQDSSGSPGAVVLPVWVTSAPNLIHSTYIPAPAVTPPRLGGTLTYLQTGRLRL